MVYATGELLSRDCDSFPRPGTASRFEEPLEYRAGGTLALVGLDIDGAGTPKPYLA